MPLRQLAAADPPAGSGAGGERPIDWALEYHTSILFFLKEPL